MKKMTDAQFKACYQLGVQVYESEISNKTAFAELVDKYGMNEDSAKMYINFFLHMMKGKRFVPSINQDGLIYYLDNVRKDYGDKQLKTFLKGLEGHILYRHSKNQPAPSFCSIYNEYSELIGLSHRF